MKGIVLAGGRGTRLSPLTEVTNKHLLPVYDKPMIIYPLQTLKTIGVTEILIITGGEHVGRFAEFLGDGTKYNVEITYRVQENSGGIAEALGLAEGFAGGEDVLVILGDNIFDNQQLKEQKKYPSDTAHIYYKRVKDPERFGVVTLKENGDALEIEEKPKDPKSDMAIVGLYHYPNNVFEVVKTLIPSERGELEISDVNNYYIKRGNLACIEIEGFWSDAGTFESLLKSANWVHSYK